MCAVNDGSNPLSAPTLLRESTTPCKSLPNAAASGPIRLFLTGPCPSTDELSVLAWLLARNPLLAPGSSCICKLRGAPLTMSLWYLQCEIEQVTYIKLMHVHVHVRAHAHVTYIPRVCGTTAHMRATVSNALHPKMRDSTSSIPFEIMNKRGLNLCTICSLCDLPSAFVLSVTECVPYVTRIHFPLWSPCFPSQCRAHRRFLTSC